MNIPPLAIPERIFRNLPFDLVNALDLQLAAIRKLASKAPRSSKYFINLKVNVRELKGQFHSHVDENITNADIFLDIHSVLAAQVLLKTWRLAQLAEGLVTALNTWNLTVSAAVARMLIETSASFYIESQEIVATWEKYKATKPKSVSDAMNIRKCLYDASGQFLWGTRLTPMLEKMLKHNVNLK